MACRAATPDLIQYPDMCQLLLCEGKMVQRRQRRFMAVHEFRHYLRHVLIFIYPIPSLAPLDCKAPELDERVSILECLNCNKSVFLCHKILAQRKKQGQPNEGLCG